MFFYVFKASLDMIEASYTVWTFFVIYLPIVIHLVIKGLRNVFLSCSTTFFETLLTNWE